VRSARGGRGGASLGVGSLEIRVDGDSPDGSERRWASFASTSRRALAMAAGELKGGRSRGQARGCSPILTSGSTVLTSGSWWRRSKAASRSGATRSCVGPSSSISPQWSSSKPPMEHPWSSGAPLSLPCSNASNPGGEKAWAREERPTLHVLLPSPLGDDDFCVDDASSVQKANGGMPLGFCNSLLESVFGSFES
jgi:hypothetical protein